MKKINLLKNDIICGETREKARIVSKNMSGVINQTASFGWHSANKNYVIFRSNGLDDEYLIILTTGKTGRIIIEGREFIAEAGSVCIIPPKLPHKYLTDSSWEFYWAHITTGVSSDMIDYIIEKRGYLFNIKDIRSITEKIERMLNTQKVGSEEDIFYSRMISEILYDLMESLLTEKKYKCDNSKIVKDILNYIEENYAKKLTIEDISRHVNMSAGHTIRCFRDQTGYTPYLYLKMSRLMKARQMLDTTSYPVKQIAMEVGYNSVSHFISDFKAQKGVTPSEYRASVLQSDQN